MSRVGSRFKWHHLGLTVIFLLSLFLNFYKLGQEGYGNLYYSSAVKSMLDNWHNFFFNSFDPKGFITIDKPPVGFWLQALSASVFGFKGWSLFLPQAIAGALSVALLYHLVARVFGRGAGLLAAFFLAITPIVVAADRTNEVDSMLMFVSLAAAWALSKAVDQSRLKWLLAAFFIVGIGFNIKMMEAFLVLPAFYLYYLLSPHLTWRKKITHLLAGTIVLTVVSFSWSVIVDSIPPDQRPYVGSTQDNSMVELALGYNGLNRLIGQQRGAQGNFYSRAQQGQKRNNYLRIQQGQRPDTLNGINSFQENEGMAANSTFTGFNGRNLSSSFMRRMGTNSAVGQTGKKGLLRLFTTPELDGQLSWLLPGVIFSIAALLWKLKFKGPFDRKRLAAIFWIVWVLAMFIFFSIASRFSSYYMVMMAPGIAAVAGAGFKQMWNQWFANGKRETWFLPIALVCTVVFDLSVVWQYPSVRFPLSITIIMLALLALIGLLFVQKGKKRFSMLAITAGVLSLAAAPAAWAMTPIEYGGSVTKPFAGPELQNQFDSGGISANRKLENYLKSHYKKGTFLAATINATEAAPIIIDTGLPVMAMGGFMGSDPAITVDGLQKLASEGQVRYFLLQGRGFGGQQSVIVNWIKANCQVVPVSQWQGPQFILNTNRNRGFQDSSLMLYEYAGK